MSMSLLLLGPKVPRQMSNPLVTLWLWLLAFCYKNSISNAISMRKMLLPLLQKDPEGCPVSGTQETQIPGKETWRSPTFFLKMSPMRTCVAFLFPNESLINHPSF